MVAWTSRGATTGGTGLGIRIAHDRGIPVLNLGVLHGLEILGNKHGLGGVRGKGLLLALDLNPRADGFALVEKALAKGLLLNAPAPDALRFVPALNVSDAEIAEMLDVLDGLLTDR